MALRRRLEGVDGISISQGEQTVQVDFAEGGRAFLPAVFRDVVDDAGVEVVAFQIDACGVIEEKESQRWLIAGENRFLLEESGTTPVGEPLCVSGSLNDRSDPQRLKITTVLPAAS